MKIWSVASLCWILGVGVLLVQAQDSSSFISIDCGASSSYVDTNLTIQYSTDVGFVDSGQNTVISSSYLSQVPYQQLKNLRVFPNGTRNCYTLKPTQGKNNKYLIRASFFYGNYDGNSQSGSFDLHIDVNYWATVSPPSGWAYLEIVYTPSRDYIQVCLVNRGQGSGTPFISALELRLLDSSIYPITSGALMLHRRYNYGSPTTYRFPHDDYDRIWLGTTSNSLISITNTTAINFKSNDNYKVPAEVLMSAFATFNSSYYLYGSLSNPNSITNWYMYFHFAEIQILQPGQVRAFKIYVEGNVLTTVTPVYLTPMTVVSPPASGSTIVYNISSTADSNLAPFLNALEVYYAIDLPNSQTNIDDVNAINAVKNAYGINRVTWQGDPCAPRDYIWSGLNCSQDTPPRIISLNLSSSGLTGQIDISFSSLDALVSLDLSSNKLVGQLPEFFAQMPNLKSLNLAGNSLSGSIPNALKKKMSDGTLNVILTGNPICQTESCTSSPTGPNAVPSPAGHKTNTIPIIIAVVASILVLV